MAMLRAALGVALVLALPAAAQETRLTATNFAPDDRPFGMALPALPAAVAANAADLRIIPLPGGAESPFRIAADLRQRSIDIASLAPRYYRAIMPYADALELIELSPTELRRNGGFDYLDRLHREALNVRLLGIFGVGARYNIYLRERRIERLNYEHVKLLVPPIAAALAKNMGAALIQMPNGEVADALGKGTIEGLIWPAWEVAPQGWAKLLKYRIEPGVMSATYAILINRTRWDALTTAHRDALARAAQALEAADAERNAQRDADAQRAEEAAGVAMFRMAEGDAGALIAMSREVAWEIIAPGDPNTARRLRRLLTNER
jgi:TRAP-type C4-dicarboxylate transport system substrate-binding protein